MRRALSLIFSMAVALTVVSAAPAMAETKYDFTATTIVAPRVPKKSEGKPAVQRVTPVGKVNLRMTKNQTAYIVSIMKFNSATDRSLADNEVVCRWEGGSKNMVIGQNVLKQNTGRPKLEDITLTTRYLVHPGVDTDVECTAQVRSISLNHDNQTYRLYDGSIEFADPDVGNATNGQPIQASVARTTYFDRTKNPVPSIDLPATGMFDLPPGYKGLSVIGDTNYVVLPACDENTEECKGGGSVASFTLYINQWKPTGELCHRERTDPKSLRMLYETHHVYVPLAKLFTLNQDPQCTRFNAYVQLNYGREYNGGTHGVATALTDSTGSTTTHRSDMSHIFVVPYK